MIAAVRPTQSIVRKFGKITLRDYQSEAADRAVAAVVRRVSGQGGKIPFVVLPTGSGKSYAGAEVARQFNEMGKKVLIVLSYASLVDQFLESFEAYGYKPWQVAVVWGDETDEVAKLKNAKVVIAMAQTLEKRRHLVDAIAPDVCLYDEAHRSYFRPIAAYLQKVPPVLMSATPHREDGALNLDDYEVINPRTMLDCIQESALVPYRIIGYDGKIKLGSVGRPNSNGEYSQVLQVQNLDHIQKSFALDQWLTVGHGAPSFWIMPSQDSAVEWADWMNAQGYKSGVVVSGNDENPGTGAKERRKMLKALGTRGGYRCLFSVSALGTGVDCPAATTLMLLRKIGSISEACQMLGRVVRTCAKIGKAFATIVDLCNTFHDGAIGPYPKQNNDGSIQLPPPHLISDWTLYPSKKGLKCGCGATSARTANNCRFCGIKLDKPEKGAEIQDLMINADGAATPTEAEYEHGQTYEMVGLGSFGAIATQLSLLPNPSEIQASAKTKKKEKGFSRSEETRYRGFLKRAVYTNRQLPSVAADLFEAEFGHPPHEGMDLVGAIYGKNPTVASFSNYLMCLASQKNQSFTKRWLKAEFGDKSQELLEQYTKSA